MNKRISAAFIVMLFALGIVSIPVSAHFTLGELTATYRYHTKDYDPHVAGVIGYVWPGVGLGGTAAGLYKPEYPGYMSPYPGWNPGTLGSGYGGTAMPSTAGYPPAWYQLDSNNYAPFGAILANTIKPGTAFASTWYDTPTIEGLPLEGPNSRGDLLFAFNATKGFWANYTDLYLFVPPEFTNIDRSRVVASWTNDYDGIRVARTDLDRNLYGSTTGGTVSTGSYLDYWASKYAPGWTVIQVHADRGQYYNTSYAGPVFGKTIYGGQKDLVTGGIFYYPRCMNFTSKAEWYYLGLNDVVAPAIAGRYFFKVGFRTPNSTINAQPAGATAPQDFFESGSYYFEFMPIENWPVLTVKGEIDPAIITGFIKYGGWNTTLYGQNVSLPGRVRAVGIADDPYTGKTLNKPVEARGYFNQTAKGHYEVEGVAPGVYDLYASCAGYPEVKIASGVKILKGQSYHIDGYLTPGAVVHGTVYSKCGTGEVPWGADQPLRIEIYAAKKTTATEVEAVKPASRFSPLKEDVTKAYETALTKTVKMPVTWSPLISPTKLGEPTYIAGTPGSTPLARAKYVLPSYAPVNEIQFQWYEYTLGNKGIDPHGVGPKQTWLTTTASTGFTWKFGDRGKYGAPSDWTGMVPEYNATWVNGLPAGQYYVRGWTLQYVQLQADGVTFEHAPFTIAPSEFPGDIDVPFDLRRGSIVKKTLHYHDVPGTLTELTNWASGFPKEPWYKPAGQNSKSFAIRTHVYVTDAAGFNWGYSGAGYTIKGPYTATIQGRDEGSYAGRSYGMPAGDFKVRDFAEGFIQDPADFWVSLGLCGTTLEVSNHVYRGVRFNITIFAKDWEHPTVDQPWKYDNDLVYVGVYKDGKLVGLAFTWTEQTAKAVQLNITEWDDDRHLVGTYGFDTGTYELKAFCYGYVQKKPVQVYGTRGSMADILIKLTEGAQIPVTMKFKHESIYEDFHWNASMRVRVFDDKNALVGEYLTSDPWHGYLTYTAASKIATQQAGVLTGNPGTLQTSTLNDKDLNYVPKEAQYLQFSICGTPGLRYWWYDNSPDPVSTFALGWTGWSTSTVAAPYGIDAAPNYMGGWRLEVDVVPWYTWKTFFPAPYGVLYGESPKYIPENHFGPWALNFPITVPSNHLGGEASLYFELDLRGSMAGQLVGYTWCDDWRPTSWAAVVFTGADGKVVERVLSLDGRYFAYLPTGMYTMTIAHGGYVSPKSPVYVTEGGSGFKNFPLERANVPIPEFPVAAVVLAFSLAASLFILRRRRK